MNPDGILCVNYIPQQRTLHVRPCMIVMPQMYQYEILFRTHDDSGHQGVVKVVVKIHERHTWPGVRFDVANHYYASKPSMQSGTLLSSTKHQQQHLQWYSSPT